MKGLFYGIGHQPNSSIFKGQLELDEAHYLVVDSRLASLPAGCTFCMATAVQTEHAVVW